MWVDNALEMQCHQQKETLLMNKTSKANKCIFKCYSFV